MFQKYFGLEFPVMLIIILKVFGNIFENKSEVFRNLTTEVNLLWYGIQ